LILPSVLGAGWARAPPVTNPAATNRPMTKLFTMKTLRVGNGRGCNAAAQWPQGTPAPAKRARTEDGDFTPVHTQMRCRSRPPSQDAAGLRMLNSAPPPPVDFRRTRVAFMTASRFLVSLVAAWLLAGAASAASPTLDRIKASGTVTFGYRDGAAPFSAKQRNGQVRGYSVELCEKVAAAVGRTLGLANLKVVWKPV